MSTTIASRSDWTKRDYWNRYIYLNNGNLAVAPTSVTLGSLPAGVFSAYSAGDLDGDHVNDVGFASVTGSGDARMLTLTVFSGADLKSPNAVGLVMPKWSSAPLSLNADTPRSSIRISDISGHNSVPRGVVALGDPRNSLLVTTLSEMFIFALSDDSARVLRPARVVDDNGRVVGNGRIIPLGDVNADGNDDVGQSDLSGKLHSIYFGPYIINASSSSPTVSLGKADVTIRTDSPIACCQAWEMLAIPSQQTPQTM